MNLLTLVSRILKSRFMKTSLRSLVKGDFLYIHNNKVIKGGLSYLDKFKLDI